MWQDHEWIKVEDGVGTIGITDHAQNQLGDVVYVELPEIGTVVAQHDTMGAVESVKAASDIYTPVSGARRGASRLLWPCLALTLMSRPDPRMRAGEVVGVNEALNDEPSLVNASPEEEGWMSKIKLSAPAELDELMVRASRWPGWATAPLWTTWMWR